MTARPALYPDMRVRMPSTVESQEKRRRSGLAHFLQLAAEEKN